MCQKSPMICGSFAKRDPQLHVSIKKVSLTPVFEKGGGFTVKMVALRVSVYVCDRAMVIGCSRSKCVLMVYSHTVTHAWTSHVSRVKIWGIDGKMVASCVSVFVREREGCWILLVKVCHVRRRPDIFCKSARRLVALLRKETRNLRHPMHLRHPVCEWVKWHVKNGGIGV